MDKTQDQRHSLSDEAFGGRVAQLLYAPVWRMLILDMPPRKIQIGQREQEPSQNNLVPPEPLRRVLVHLVRAKL